MRAATLARRYELDPRCASDTQQFLSPAAFAAYITAIVAVGLLGSIWAVSLATQPLSRLSERGRPFPGRRPCRDDRGDRPARGEAPPSLQNRMQRRLRQFISDRPVAGRHHPRFGTR